MQSVAHGVQAGATQELANLAPCQCDLEEDMAIFAEGKVATSTSKGVAKGSEGKQGQ